MIFVSSSWRKKAEEEEAEEEAKPVCVWFGGISPNFELKNMISTHTEDLSYNKDLNGTNSPDFEEFFFSNRQIFMISSQ